MTNKNSKNEVNKKTWCKSNAQKNFDSSIGVLLETTRRSLGYSRETVLNELNTLYKDEHPISDDYYGRIERGERSISAYKLLLLVNYFNTAIDQSNHKNNTNLKKLHLDELLILIKNN